VTGRERPDSLGLWEATAALPERLDEQLEASQRAVTGARLPDPSAVHSVAVFAHGAGRTAGAAVAAIAAPHAPTPVWVGAGPTVPAFVDAHTLALAVSCTGDDVETGSAAREAARRGAHVVVVAPEGPLAALAQGASGPTASARVPIVPNGATERAHLGPAVVALLTTLSGCGLLPDHASSVGAAASALRRKRDALLTPGGPAEEVARRLGRTIPLVYGSDGVTAVAAQRWKAQVNLNAKAPAFCAALPGLAHDELAGWGQSGDVTRQVVSLVLLRHDGEDQRTAALFEAVVRSVDEVMAAVLDVRAEGPDDVARFFDLVLTGDVVSLLLAAREGVDPGPVPAVEEAGAGPA